MTDRTTLEPLPEKWERGLAIVAHPDDLEYGAASAVARWTAMGKEFSYLLVTSGEAGIDGMSPDQAAGVREEEERRSASVVGVDTVEFLGHRDGVVEYSLKLRTDIARVIRRVRPELVVTANFQLTWGNQALNMADHRAVGLAALDAARDAGNRWIFPELLEEGLRPWTGVTMVCVTGSPHPTHGVDVTTTIDRGVASLKEHKAYIEGLGGEFDVDKFLRGAAASVGPQLDTEFAVAFEVIWI